MKRRTEEWEYEFLDSRGRKQWIREDDEHSARNKAKYASWATGRVRGRVVVTKTSKWEVHEKEGQ